MKFSIYVAAFVALSLASCDGFQSVTTASSVSSLRHQEQQQAATVTNNDGLSTHSRRIPSALFAGADSKGDEDDDDEDEYEAEADIAIQWELFKKHHAKGSWKGVWTTYNFIGDIIDETVASVDLNLQSKFDDMVVDHAHTIVVGAKKSDCETCFDSFDTKTLPVARYTPETLSQRNRLGANGMVIGPSILKSGAMATELVLSYGDGRVRVTFQHAPVWAAGVEPGSCPPQGLKLFRAMLSREALRESAPTAETESKNPPIEGNPIFSRPVPPFNYHKKWGGSSWTWGPQTGNKGWGIEELEESDSWHGITPADSWNLRLPGGIHVQAPKVVNDASTGLCRMAWLPDDETLLRIEGGVTALQPLMLDDDQMVGFEPPSLSSYRCDVMKKMGELENISRPSQDLNKSDSATKPKSDDTASKTTSKGGDEENFDATKPNGLAEGSQKPDEDSGLESIRDALSL
uniref:DUF3598 domain-containing protein n=1 Tax=Craspedostauros australis TaxID=1486917 RepID=A0A7R9WYV5_9STRA|eukprot:CAMPEP_0198133590 /NCGR_PEP_ID=MMETSP1442-20131203/59640_1 /TAXON_ID= /ORGANISM="Craspedostauros australis, Strain CCMP3328" /LENGTH=460 /DNA_ID=CAMNT_0043794715 /DNA_START=70 /DNA_END=1452 /DNA_ORIENTATION=-